MTNAEIDGCLGCEGQCCTTYIVPLTGYDVWRIVQAQRLAPELFVQREPEDYPTDTGFLLRPVGSTYGLSLQHHHTRRNERPCVFLMQLREGVQRCGIYAHRPLACQTYPIHIQQEQPLPREDMLCPPGSWSGAAHNPASWRERLQLQDQQWQQYAGVVRAWNDAVRARPVEQGYVLGQYLDYLVNAYDALEGVRLARQDPSHAAMDRALASLAEDFMRFQA